MQREGGDTMRQGFSMLTAIFVIVIMATVSALILNISAKTVKSTTIQYKHEQAILYAKSYTELAIMYASANDTNDTDCAEDINGVIGSNADAGDGYDIQVRISYIGNDLNGCSLSRILNTASITTTKERHIIVDVYVRYRDPEMIAAWGTPNGVPWVTYHRRTLQKL